MKSSSSDIEIDLASKEHFDYYIEFLSKISKLTSGIEQERIEELKELLENLKSKKDLQRMYSQSLMIWYRILEHIFHLGIPNDKRIFSTINKALPLFEQLQKLSAEQFPRDHVIHALHVLCVGTALIRMNPDLWERRIRTRIEQMLKFVFIEEDLRDEALNKLSGTASHLILTIYANWILASLAHDLGYIIVGLREKLQPQFIVSPFVKNEEELKRLVGLYQTFFSNLFGSAVELGGYLDDKEHDCLSAIFLTPGLKVYDKVLLLSRPEYATYYETSFAIAFHDTPFLSPLSPMLQLLVIADTLEEIERHISVDKKTELRSELEKAIIRSKGGNEIQAILDFKKKEDAKDFFEKTKETFELQGQVKNVIESDSFPSVYGKMNMTGLRVWVEIHPPCDRFALLLHEECGRLSMIDKSTDAFRCQYCPSISP